MGQLHRIHVSGPAHEAPYPTLTKIKKKPTKVFGIKLSQINLVGLYYFQSIGNVPKNQKPYSHDD
jgi:hypothetical protein